MSRRHALDADPEFRKLTGNIVFPGFTAPKLAVGEETTSPAFSRRSRKVLLPKDYLRLWLTGEYISEMSDSAGTAWLDVERRAWSPNCSPRPSSTRQHMPALVEGTAARRHAARRSSPRNGAWARAWSSPAAPATMRPRPAAWARSGPALPSCRSARPACCLPPTASYLPNPESAVHTFCHALPNAWHQMGVILSATDSLNWLSGGDRQVGGGTDRGARRRCCKAPGSVIVPALSLRRAHAAQRRRDPRLVHRARP